MWPKLFWNMKVDIIVIKPQKKRGIFYFTIEAVPLVLNIPNFPFFAKSSLSDDQIL
jgi:hypothetical protein